MPGMWRNFTTTLLLVFLPLSALAQPRQFKPGFNLFSKDQDVQLGKEAAGEIEKQSEVIASPELNDYVARVGKKLAAQPEADKYPYTFRVVNDKSINAFALPGGPAFVHTGLIAAVDNEAQLAGVLAHEISHVALRHGTNQATKANFLQLGAALAGSALGNGSMLARLGQLGIGLGANSVFLKFSRSAETEADLLGSRIMAKAGYDPTEMARFFEKLEAEGGARGPQFLSDHPNPGNRTKAIQQEVTYMPKRTYAVGDARQLSRAKTVVAALPPPKKVRGEAAATATLSIPDSRPSSRTVEYQGREFRLLYPDNWKTFPSQDASSLSIASPSGMQQTENGANVGYGALVSTYAPQAQGASLRTATDELIGRMRSGDPSLRIVEAARETTLSGDRALVTLLTSQSIFLGQTESARLVTVLRAGALFYVVQVAPQSEAQYVNGTFESMLRSLRFNR